MNEVEDSSDLVRDDGVGAHVGSVWSSVEMGCCSVPGNVKKGFPSFLESLCGAGDSCRSAKCILFFCVPYAGFRQDKVHEWGKWDLTG